VVEAAVWALLRHEDPNKNKAKLKAVVLRCVMSIPLVQTRLVSGVGMGAVAQRFNGSMQCRTGLRAALSHEYGI
jgi:hypothetical protein